MEAAFALGAINGLRHPAALRAAFHAAVQDTFPRVQNRLENALDHLPRGPIPIDDAFSRELLDGLSRSQPLRTRLWALRIASFANVPWGAPEFSRLLGDGDPAIRYSAMFALATVQPATPGARAAIERLSADSVKRVRDAVRPAIGMLKTGPRPPLACSHRGTPSPTSLQVTIDSSSRSLRSDGRGSYQHGRDRVRTIRSFAFNLLMSAAEDRDGSPVDTTGSFTNRALLFDLSQPVVATGAMSLGVVRDSAAILHFHWMWDPGRRVEWTFDDMPVGGRGTSDRTQFEFSIGGHPYVLQFGQWGQGDCGEPYAYGARLNGNGTTGVEIERLAEDEYRLVAPPGGVARLWDYRVPQAPRDLGLYSFSFSLRLTRAP
jgi:hypothetical protein